jgi:hypothetical protein
MISNEIKGRLDLSQPLYIHAHATTNKTQRNPVEALQDASPVVTRMVMVRNGLPAQRQPAGPLQARQWSARKQPISQGQPRWALG